MRRFPSRNSCWIWATYVACIFAAGHSARAEEEMRTWSDATGKYKMEARYTGMKGTKVQLTRSNGKKMEIDRKQLGEDDQKYLDSLDAKNSPFKPAMDDDSKPPKADDSREAKEDASDETGDAVPRKVSVDWSASQAIRLESPGGDWTASVAPYPGWKAKPKTVTLPAKVDFFEGVNGMAVNAVAEKALVCYHLGHPGGGGHRLRLVTCDLASGKPSPIAAVEAEMAPLALGDDGNLVLMRRDAFGFGNHETLELWMIRGKKVRRTLSWTAYDDGWQPNRDVNWGEFVDADHALTASANGKVALWDLKTAQPLWHFETRHGATPCLSGDRKTLGFCTSDRVGLFDIASRKVIAMASTPRPLTGPITAFSPTGKRLACIAQNRILVWDTSNGKLFADFETPGINVAGGIGFPDDRFLLCGNKFVVELANQLKLWDYSGAERMQTVGPLTVAAIMPQGAAGALLAIDLPHREARDFLDKALTQPDLFVFRAGTKVKLDVKGVPAGDREHVREISDGEA